MNKINLTLSLVYIFGLKKNIIDFREEFYLFKEI